jgi:hypothetical protein
MRTARQFRLEFGGNLRGKVKCGDNTGRRDEHLKKE